MIHLCAKNYKDIVKFGEVITLCCLSGQVILRQIHSFHKIALKITKYQYFQKYSRTKKQKGNIY